MHGWVMAYKTTSHDFTKVIEDHPKTRGKYSCSIWARKARKTNMPTRFTQLHLLINMQISIMNMQIMYELLMRTHYRFRFRTREVGMEM